MAQEKIDFIAMLADARAKRTALDALISGLEIAIASGALGPAVEGMTTSGISSGPTPLGKPIDLPAGAFNGKSLLEAIKLYLEAARQRKTKKEIVAALREGGVVSTSDNFEGVVQASLQRLKSLGQLLKFGDGWGLAEWSPPSFRGSTAKPAKAKKPRKGKVKGKAAQTAQKKAKTEKPIATAATKPAEKIGSQAAIESYYAANPGGEFSTAELAKALGISTGGANLVCAKLAHQGKLEKTPTGKYRSTKLHAMPKAV